MKMVASRTVRNSSLILGVAISSLFLSPSKSHAGPAELKALATALNGNVTPPTAEQAGILNTASSEDLAMAVMEAIKFTTSAKAAAFVGEALKRSGKTDFGSVMGTKLDSARSMNAYMSIFNSNPDPVKNAAAIAKFIGTSAKNAATGAAPFTEWVDEFVFKLATTDQQAFDAAKAAIASKTAVGAVIGSRMYDPAIDTDAERLTLAQRAMLAKNVAIDGTVGSEGQGLTNAALEIARAITQGVSLAARVQDPEKFVADLLNTSAKAPTSTKPATQPLLAKITSIAPGVVAGSPEKAGEVLESLFTNHNNATPGQGEASYDPLTKKTTGSSIALATIKNASKLASAIGLVADTEEYSFLAASFGQRVGTSVIKSTLVSGLAKALVSSMVKKPLPSNVNPVLGQARDNAANRADEAGEVAAYLLNAIAGNNTASGTDGLAIFKTGATDKITTKNKKAATSMVLGIIKSVVNAYNVKKSLTFNPTVIAADVAGSVAQTLLSLNAAGAITNDIYQAIKDSLLLAKTATSINKTKAADIAAALNSVLVAGNAGTKYEDGTVFNNQVGSGAVTEPETDIRGA